MTRGSEGLIAGLVPPAGISVPLPAAPPRQALQGRICDRVMSALRRRDARHTVRGLSAFVGSNDRVLDLGCGTGLVGALLEQQRGCNVVGCDVLPMNVALRDFHLFDGQHIPFGSRAFHLTMLSFVLHHVPDPMVLLREAARVTRNRVIVIEDTPTCSADRVWGSLHVHGFNRTYGLPHGRVRPEHEWLRIFAAAGLRVAERRPFRRLERFPPIARTQFVLEREVP